MSFASKYNKGSKFSVDTTGWTEYKKLQDLDEGKVYPILGFYINRKSKFGDAPVIISDGFFVNLPAHLIETVQDILADDEAIQQIEADKAGFKVRTYEATNWKNKKCYSVEFVDR